MISDYTTHLVAQLLMIAHQVVVLSSRVQCLLTAVHVWRTQVGPEGAIALAAAVKVNPVLSYLNLSGTSIGERAITVQATFLKLALVSSFNEVLRSNQRQKWATVACVG
jgi:hypothetical protein